MRGATPVTAFLGEATCGNWSKSCSFSKGLDWLFTVQQGEPGLAVSAIVSEKVLLSLHHTAFRSSLRSAMDLATPHIRHEPSALWDTRSTCKEVGAHKWFFRAGRQMWGVSVCLWRRVSHRLLSHLHTRSVLLSNHYWRRFWVLLRWRGCLWGWESAFLLGKSSPDVLEATSRCDCGTPQSPNL